MSNPYELRLDLYNSAKDFIQEKYNAEVNRYDAAFSAFLEKKERWQVLKDMGQDPGEYPSVSLPQYPSFPSPDDIAEFAVHIRSFVSDKGEE
tara:strand:+ start:716 stop:991 length:276 start_codon:yes stop_codon:yes gene_type:complete